MFASSTSAHPTSPTYTEGVVSCRGLVKIYGEKGTSVTALDHVSISFEESKLTAIMGPSGSGKSTLMHCLAGLDSPSSGEIKLEGSEITHMNERQLTKVRRDRIGFIFQSFNLVPTLTVKQNITLPASIAGKKIPDERLREVVEAVGLTDRLSHRPSELSGGQQQRVACARALVTEPAVIFADEPTGNLDSRSSRQILEFLRRAVDVYGQSVIMVTHDVDAAAWADRVVFLADGKVAGELISPSRDMVLDALRELGHDTEVSLEEQLTHMAPSGELPPAAAELADRAKQILDNLPGSVIGQ